MTTERWRRSITSVYNVSYHLIWCPKYRRAILVDKIAEDLKSLLLQKAKELDVQLETMEVMPDHVHIFVKSSPTFAPHWVVQQLKGYTSRILRQKYPELRSKIPSLWTRSYYCESIGHISEKTIKKYIEDQKGK